MANHWTEEDLHSAGARTVEKKIGGGLVSGAFVWSWVLRSTCGMARWWISSCTTQPHPIKEFRYAMDGALKSSYYFGWKLVVFQQAWWTIRPCITPVLMVLCLCICYKGNKYCLLCIRPASLHRSPGDGKKIRVEVLDAGRAWNASMSLPAWLSCCCWVGHVSD
jgi:hypothetical protein